MTADRPTTEPRTEAGKALLDMIYDPDCSYSESMVNRGVLAIEAEAAQGAAPHDCVAAEAEIERLTAESRRIPMTADRPTTEPRTMREAALAVVREWNAGARAGMGFTPMWNAMENLVAALVEAEAAQGAAPLTDWEKSQLPRHTDDGNGGCIVCREWDGTFGEDDEMPTTIVSWPCAKVRLAELSEGAAPRAEGPDVERLFLDILNITDGTPSYYDREVSDIRAAARSVAARLMSLDR